MSKIRKGSFPSHCDVQITESEKIRRASAFMRGGTVHVRVPASWPEGLKQESVQTLLLRVLQKEQAQASLLAALSTDAPMISIRTEAELAAFVRQVNAETFQVPLGEIRIGHARYSRLAQVNLRTRTMTVSRYSLEEAPLSALRYLIVHELAHFLEPGHTRRFWSLVARYVPDYRRQSRLMKAYHRRAVLRAEADESLN